MCACFYSLSLSLSISLSLSLSLSLQNNRHSFHLDIHSCHPKHTKVNRPIHFNFASVIKTNKNNNNNSSEHNILPFVNTCTYNLRNTIISPSAQWLCHRLMGWVRISIPAPTQSGYIKVQLVGVTPLHPLLSR